MSDAPRLPLDGTMRAALRETRQRARAQKNPFHATRLADAHGGVSVMATPGAVWVLRESGELFELQGLDGEGPLVPLAPDLLEDALGYGAGEYEWLKPLLPRAAPDSRVCALCRGQRFLDASILCSACHGTGFLDRADGTTPLFANGTNSSEPLDGFLAEYWAQGMEGERWRIFQDAAQIDGDEWRMEGLHRVQPGDRLWAWNHDGSLAFEATLRPMLRLFRRNLLPQDPGYAPDGMDANTFEAAFRARPPLRAWLWRVG